MKKGFTLIELLAVIVVLSLIMVIAVPQIYKAINDSKIRTYIINDKMVAEAAKKYFDTDINAPSINIGETKEVTINTLMDNKYITKMKNPNNSSEQCNGYVLITRIDNTNYTFTPNITCDNSSITSRDTDKLVAYYSFDDFQESTKNLIPNSPINSYPTYGNTHGTYNTNQYNNNVYFSIGTIVSVVNNVVTLSGITHPIYTYDALTPQTSGGGVTAGTNYFIKKLSSNTFTLHQYDSSQDGSKGFKVYDSINNDTRIQINATNFPTMWNGKPHLPNSALVKEIINNCYKNSGTFHDCIRLHTEHKIEGDVDGMAYSVTPTVEQGKTYTFSFYFRAANESSVGKTIHLNLYTGAGWPGTNVQKQASLEWQRYEYTGVAPNAGATMLYFWPQKGSTLDITEIQCEEKKYSTPFTINERTGVVKDYSGNSNNATLQLSTTPKWIEDAKIGEGSYKFDGIDDFINGGNNSSLMPTSISVGFWIKFNTTENNNWMAVNKSSGGTSGAYYIYGDSLSASWWAIFGPSGTRYDVSLNTTFEKEKWYHIVGTYDSSTKIMKAYVNGELKGTTTNAELGSNTDNILLGRYTGGYYLDGYLDDVKIYGRALSDKEIEIEYKKVDIK